MDKIRVIKSQTNYDDDTAKKIRTMERRLYESNKRIFKENLMNQKRKKIIQ